MEQVTIKSADGRSSAGFLPELGLNCYSLSLQCGGIVADVIWTPEGFESGQLRPSSGGMPILFPFPGRIRAGRYSWDGKSFELPQNDRKGNAIHGFVYDRPWNVLEVAGDALKAEFQASKQDPEILKLWPADFLISVEYKLRAHCLQLTTRISNPDDRALPFGYGLHPYFRVPFDQGNAAGTRVQLPVSRHWELENLVPNGMQASVENIGTFASGLLFEEAELDDVFTIATDSPAGVDAAPNSSRIVGEQAVLEYRYGGFEYLVVYTPPTRQSICIEPYSSTPNMFELTDKGIDCGMRVLQPGEMVEFQTELQLKARR